MEREYIDLHVHSTASDGTMTPGEIVKYGEEKKLHTIALTDHDTVAGVDEAIEEAKNKIINVIPGIEMSADFNNRELHILGLNVDHKDSIFLEKINKCKSERDERNHKIVKKMSTAGMDITMNGIYEKYGDASITRAHFARFLLEEGYVETKDEAFAKYLGINRPFYVPRNKLKPEDAINIILEAGGFPVLAHPLLYKLDDERLKSIISYLKGKGLLGIEGIYSLNRPEDDRKLYKIAKNYDLFITGGSDFHGSNKPNIDLGTGKGNLRVDKNILNHVKK